MAIIGIVGFIGSGKGSVGNLLEERGWHQDSFASPLKDAVSNIFGWSREMLEGDTQVSREWREKPDEFWSSRFGKQFTPRLALQLMGTEAGRDVFHKDIWVLSLLNRVKNKDVVVTDVRFKNEVKYIQDNGGLVVRIRRGEDPHWYDIAKAAHEGNRGAMHTMLSTGIHVSEWDWVGCEFDYTIENNGTLQDLGNSVDSMLQYFKK